MSTQPPPPANHAPGRAQLLARVSHWYGPGGQPLATAYATVAGELGLSQPTVERRHLVALREALNCLPPGPGR